VIRVQKGARARRRSGRPSRSDALATVTELDQQLLIAVSSQRVLTQTQLEGLFTSTPGRTLRYRTERLTRLGLLGRSRPYRDKGSAPFHYWPTRVADPFARGEPLPRGGERPEPNPQLLRLLHPLQVRPRQMQRRTAAQSEARRGRAHPARRPLPRRHAHRTSARQRRTPNRKRTTPTRRAARLDPRRDRPARAQTRPLPRSLRKRRPLSHALPRTCPQPPRPSRNAPRARNRTGTPGSPHMPTHRRTPPR
jgi:hypothetical protein